MKNNFRRKLSLARIYANSTKQVNNGVVCQIWRLGHTGSGYPVVHDPQIYYSDSTRNRMVSVRRAVWLLKFHALPEGANQIVMRCKNRSCVAWPCMEAMSFGDASRFMREAPGVLAQVSRIVNMPQVPRKPLPQSSIFHLAA